jgi:HD superfamily phosphohydrolase
MTEALRVLIAKGVKITDEECQAACIAILLHDIGHGPFSHALENLISPLPHEDISLNLMTDLNLQFNGELSMAIDVFTGAYSKPFLHELVSSQLDMDRMDYLTRDSFFTGVTEGIIGYDRIIKMLDVRNNHIVVEEKAVNSIEKYLISRHFMYWQVYLHKTVLSTEIMLQEFFKRVKTDYAKGNSHGISQNLTDFLGTNDLMAFVKLDDSDLQYTIKSHLTSDDQVLKILANGLYNRKLFKLILSSQHEIENRTGDLIAKIDAAGQLGNEYSKELIFTGKEITTFYTPNTEEILILTKEQEVYPFSSKSRFQEMQTDTELHYICYPKYFDKV